jgi:hypothetical protein
MTWAVLSLVSLLLLVFWVYQFVLLMLLGDEDFPGRHDKILWVAVFVLLSVIAPFAFLWWKRACLTMRADDRRSAG